MSIEFGYRRERSSNEGFIYRPVAKVKLTGKNRREIIDYFYIDSGADYTLIPYKLGHFLGLESGEVHEVQGISGVIGIMFSVLQMQIGEYKFNAKIGWAQIEHVPMLLGRKGVFEKFDITFKEGDKKVVFNPKL